MTTLASADDLKTYLQDPNLPDDVATLALEASSGLIRDYCHISFDFVADDVVVLDGTGSTALLLPEVPVSLVSEVRELGVVLDPDSYEWDQDGIITRLDWRVGWRRIKRAYQVIFDHGYAASPESVRAVCYRVAARGITNPGGLSQETVGRYTAQYGFDATRLLTLGDPDRRDLDPFRIEGRPKSAVVGAAS